MKTDIGHLCTKTLSGLDDVL